MDIKDLRIGNLIERNGVIAKIELINNEIDEVYFIGDDFYYNDFCCNIYPIPLTEELLFKMGFIEDGVWCHKTLNLNHDRLLGFDLQNNHIFLGQWNKVSDSKSIKHDFRDTFLIKCEYVHQLQNLYFALTQTELTLS